MRIILVKCEFYMAIDNKEEADQVAQEEISSNPEAHTVTQFMPSGEVPPGDIYNICEDDWDAGNMHHVRYWFSCLDKALDITKLPTKGGKNRWAKGDEFMFMGFTKNDGYVVGNQLMAMFKHIVTRNYLYIDMNGSIIIQTDGPWHRGEFDASLRNVRRPQWYSPSCSMGKDGMREMPGENREVLHMQSEQKRLLLLTSGFVEFEFNFNDTRDLFCRYGMEFLEIKRDCSCHVCDICYDDDHDLISFVDTKGDVKELCADCWESFVRGHWPPACHPNTIE